MATFGDIAEGKPLKETKETEVDPTEAMAAEKLDPEELMMLSDDELPQALVVEAATGTRNYKVTGPKGRTINQPENFDRASHVTIELSRISKNGAGVIHESSRSVAVPLPFRTDQISLVTDEGYKPKDVVRYVLNMIDRGAPLIVHHVNPAILAMERKSTKARAKKALSRHTVSPKAQRLMTA